MKTYNFALIGCGRIAIKHAKILSKMENCNLYCVCDIKEQLAKDFAEKFKCKHYTTYDEVLDDPNVECVDICTPSGLHPSMAIKAAKKKKHVITEKPMALNVKDALEMIDVCKKEDVKLFVIKQNRLNPPILELRKALDAGRFGKLVLLNTTVRWYRPQEYYDQADWRGTKNMDGGVLLNQASHHIDLLRWFGGPVKSVFGMKKTQTHNIEAEDTANAVIEFKNGALGTIEVTTCSYPENLEGSITIIGENGVAKVGGFAVNKMDIWRFKDHRGGDDYISKSATNPPDVYGFGHKIFFENVINTLNGKDNSKIDGEEGIKSIKLIEAIYKSAEQKRLIEFEDE